jgi:hypothetical protein
VFSGFAPTPLPYRWDVRGDTVKISVLYGQLDATVNGAWREDGTFSGGWRPNPGADETANPPTTSVVTGSPDRARSRCLPGRNLHWPRDVRN